MASPNDLSYFDRGVPYAYGSSAVSTLGLDFFVKGAAFKQGLTNSAAWTEEQDDAEGLTDAATKVVATARPRTDSQGLTDSVTALNGGQVSKSEAMGLRDTSSRVVPHIRVITDVVGETDLAAGPNTHTLTVIINDAMSSNDISIGGAAPRLNNLDFFDHGRPFVVGIGKTSTLGLDVFSRGVPASFWSAPPSIGSLDAATYARSRSDSLGITDVAGFGKTALFANPEGITDNVNIATGSSRLLSDNVGEQDAGIAASTSSDPERLTDAMTQVSGKPFTENETLHDTVARALAKSLSELSLIHDAIATVKTTAAPLTNPEALTDSATRVFGVLRTNSNPMALTDVTSRLHTYSRPQSDAQGITDSLAQIVTTVRKLVDNLPEGDAVGLLFNANASALVADPEGLSDSMSSLEVVARTRNDTVGINDSVLRAVTRLMPTDSLGLTDNVQRMWVRTLVDSMQGTDAYLQASVYLLILADSLNNSDSSGYINVTPFTITIDDQGAIQDLLRAYNSSLKKFGRREHTNPVRARRGSG